VDDEEVLSILRTADVAADLPRFGGMARPQGVFIASRDRWAFADTTGAIAGGPAPRTPSVLRQVPIVRGIIRLACAIAPALAGRRAGGKRERPVFVAALLLPAAFAFLPELQATLLGALTSAAFLLWLFRGRTLQLHGAEHRAIAAAETRTLVDTWHGRAKPSRFALRCGTNFAALALPLAFAVQSWWPLAPASYNPVVLSALSLGVAMELWQAIHAGPRLLAQALLAPGLALQRITTREPALDETRLALRALATVLQGETA
jgi:hypothetical protein